MARLRAITAVIVTVALAIWAGCDMSTSGPEQHTEALDIQRGPDVEFVRRYDQGYERAKREGKPMLVFFAAEWCNFCRQMTAEAFADADVVRWCENFVCIRVDADRDSEVCREFRVRGYPTVQFLSPRGVPLNRVVGKQPADRLVVEMQAALGATASRTARTAVQ